MQQSLVTFKSECQRKVNDWIKANFDLSEIVVEEFLVLPYGRLIKDRNGDQMAVFYDYFYDRVSYFFPDEK